MAPPDRSPCPQCHRSRIQRCMGTGALLSQRHDGPSLPYPTRSSSSQHGRRHSRLRRRRDPPRRRHQSPPELHVPSAPNAANRLLQIQLPMGPPRRTMEAPPSHILERRPNRQTRKPTNGQARRGNLQRGMALQFLFVESAGHGE